MTPDAGAQSLRAEVAYEHHAASSMGWPAATALSTLCLALAACFVALTRRI